MAITSTPAYSCNVASAPHLLTFALRAKVLLLSQSEHEDAPA